MLTLIKLFLYLFFLATQLLIGFNMSEGPWTHHRVVLLESRTSAATKCVAFLVFFSIFFFSFSVFSFRFLLFSPAAAYRFSHIRGSLNAPQSSAFGERSLLTANCSVILTWKVVRTVQKNEFVITENPKCEIIIGTYRRVAEFLMTFRR